MATIGAIPAEGRGTRGAGPGARLNGFLAVLLIGLPGSGKSTLARELAGRFGMGILSRDRLRESMFPLGHGAPLERRAATRALVLALEMSILLRHPVVVDGMSLARREDRERLRRLLDRFAAPALELFLDCPPAVAQARVLASRMGAGRGGNEGGAGSVLACAARFDPVEPHVLRLDACETPERLAETAASALRERAERLGLLAAASPPSG